MPHATPLPIAEKAKAAIARQEAIERKCAQASRTSTSIEAQNASRR
jgi:hypothetical protein